MESPPGRRITPRARNTFQFLTAAATGLTAFGALTGTGLVTGQIAAAFDRQTALEPVAPVQEPARVVTKRRPHRTVVRTVVVNRASAAHVVSPGTGGTVRAATGRSSGSGSGYHPSSSRPPAAPKPAPPPAPSSGS
jgi:hypothetical protein